MALIPMVYTLPASWASALINGDLSGLDAAERAELLQFTTDNPEMSAPVSCDESFIGRFGGLMREVCEFTYLRTYPRGLLA